MAQRHRPQPGAHPGQYMLSLTRGIPPREGWIWCWRSLLKTMGVLQLPPTIAQRYSQGFPVTESSASHRNLAELAPSYSSHFFRALSSVGKIPGCLSDSRVSSGLAAFGQSVGQSVGRSVGQPASQPVSHSVSQSVHTSVRQLSRYPVRCDRPASSYAVIQLDATALPAVPRVQRVANSTHRRRRTLLRYSKAEPLTTMMERRRGDTLADRAEQSGKADEGAVASFRQTANPEECCKKHD